MSSDPPPTTTPTLASADESAALRAANEELRRLLRKETNLVTSVLRAGEADQCSQCARHRAALQSVRRDNAQEFRWVEHFQRTSHNLRTQLQEKAERLEAALSALQARYRELELRKDDPHGRDDEIRRVRDGYAAARRDWANANQTALEANRASESLAAELGAARARIRSLEADVRESAGRARMLEETVDACRRAPELRDCRVGTCADLRCRKRDLELQLGRQEAAEEVVALRGENYELRDQVKKCRAELVGYQERVEEAAAATCRPVFQIIEHTARPLVASLDEGMEDLKMNLKSFLLIFPGNDSEWDEAAMYAAFLLDLPPSEREANIAWMYAACHRGRPLPPAEAERFRLASTPERPEPVCRPCFAACVLAIGGNFVRVGARSVWTNVRPARASVFAAV